jgi:cell fate (sporulation/competence/biofilm development) regulator YlbF (YheA/YmcA/DUF963 family)
MQTQTETEASPVILKTRELCQAILDQPEIRALRKDVEAFMANDQARTQYESLMTRGELLHEKQHAGTPISEAEAAEFEKLRQSFLGNPVARGFLDAQEEMQRIHKSVSQYVSKTFELGRVPEEGDLESGSCGEGCGCHH